MDIRPVPTKERPWTFDFRNQWKGVFNPSNWNWIDFTFFQFEIEWEKWLGNINWTIALFGFKCVGAYCYDPNADFLKKIEDGLRQSSGDDGVKDSETTE